MSQRYLIGIDIGGTKCAVVLGKKGATEYERIAFPTAVTRGPDAILSDIILTIEEILLQNKISLDQVESIGISCGGPLDSIKGLILSPPNLPGWDNIPIVQLMEQRFGKKTYLQNDANACALAEWKYGAGRGCRNMVFLTFGTGLGAGLILDGIIYTGTNDMAGEVGHIRLAESGPIGYGKAGSFEGFCSGAGIAQLARDEVRKRLTSGKKVEFCSSIEEVGVLTTKDIGLAAAKGDRVAIEILELAGRYLGLGLSILIDILNPERIIIGGVFARCREFLQPAAEKVIAKEALLSSYQACKILPAALGEKIGDYACLVVALGDALGTVPVASRCNGNRPQCIPVHLDLFEQLFFRYPILEVCRPDIYKAFEILVKCYENGGKVLICGNGGSGADASHIVGELMKGFMKKRAISDIDKSKWIAIDAEKGKILAEKLQGALPAIDLTAQSAIFTAFANDVDADLVFAQQTFGYGRKGDVLICLSTSGNSKNILYAALTAKVVGMASIGLTGEAGGQMSQLCDVTIRVPRSITPEIQELHLPIYHTLCAMLEEYFFSFDRENKLKAEA